MAISQAIIKTIVSIDRRHRVLFTNRYIVKCLCVFKLVRVLLVEQCQSRRILWCLSLMFTISMSHLSHLILHNLIYIYYLLLTYPQLEEHVSVCEVVTIKKKKKKKIVRVKI